MTSIDLSIARKRYPDGPLELACIFRDIALDVLADRDTALRYLDHPQFAQVYDDRASSCLERAVMYEILAYGDPGALLSCPGPSLSGLIIREIGSKDQCDLFFSYVAANRARTFMAVTEPDKGSDAGNILARIEPDGRLYGEKWFVGNGRDGEIGTIIVRNGEGPFSIGVAMLTPAVLNDPRVERQHLPVAGMKGAGLTHLRFHGAQLGQENLLGQDKRPLERGMLALIKTFYRMRPAVTAMALGSAQALLDVLKLQWDVLDEHARNTHDAMQARTDAARRLNRAAARQIDAGLMDAASVSTAKAAATEIAEEIVRALPRLLGIRRFVESPWLMKSFTDIHGYEWMEGSKDMQRFNIFRAL